LLNGGQRPAFGRRYTAAADQFLGEGHGVCLLRHAILFLPDVFAYLFMAAA
jgi:hypothetical protein